MVEQLTLNQLVLGSSPSRGTTSSPTFVYRRSMRTSRTGRSCIFTMMFKTHVARRGCNCWNWSKRRGGSGRRSSRRGANWVGNDGSRLSPFRHLDFASGGHGCAPSAGARVLRGLRAEITGAAERIRRWPPPRRIGTSTAAGTRASASVTGCRSFQQVPMLDGFFGGAQPRFARCENHLNLPALVDAGMGLF